MRKFVCLSLFASAVLGLYRGWPSLLAAPTKKATGGRRKKVK